MKTLNDKELSARGLTRPRAEALVRSVRDDQGRRGLLSRVANGPMTRLLEAHGYVEFVLSHTPGEIADLEAGRDNFVLEAHKELVDNDDWRKCLDLLSQARKTELISERKAWRLTEKAQAFVREVNEQ